MNGNKYSISADSRRWWWPSAAAGAAAFTAAVAIPVSAGHAIPVDDPPARTGAGRTGGVAAAVDTGGRPCFMIHARWNVAADGPQPVCGTTPAGPRVEATTVDCPPPPDIRYVGVPWVPPEPTGCESIDRWWTVRPISVVG